MVYYSASKSQKMDESRSEDALDLLVKFVETAETIETVETIEIMETDGSWDY